MKKKIALAAALILILSIAGYGTYAYLTASKTANNVITAGTVKIELNKVQDEKLLVMPATTGKREVIVTNSGGNACYVRVKIETTVNPDPEAEASLDPDKIALQLNEADWVKGTGDDYWYYSKVLEPKDSTKNLLEGINFDKSMGNEYQNATFTISVSAQAVQAENNGFETPAGSVLDVKGWPSAAPASANP